MPTRPARRHPPACTPFPGLDALLALNHDHYRDYADLLLGPADADLALRAASEYLAQTWQAILGTESPAACAWHAVRQRVHLLAGPGPLRPVEHLVPHLQDIVLLHLALGLAPEQVAFLTGTRPADVHTRIRALGTMGSC
ncbi:hypothetical protein [Streptomyces novaecaesareae]|uniref:hypothetical protein n=1 Tax=Streptomyces novaecaesareae TaxID=68244 RepID=UPI0004AA1F08|nr:hypothetical protein [Streptomyces novaecaesareae]